MNRYIINMIGIGESYLMLVSKDLWDWVTDYSGKTPCPKRLEDKMWELIGDEFEDRLDMLSHFSSRVPDDRTSYLTELDEVPYLDDVMDVMKYVKKHNINVVSECSLVIC